MLARGTPRGRGRGIYVEPGAPGAVRRARVDAVKQRDFFSYGRFGFRDYQTVSPRSTGGFNYKSPSQPLPHSTSLSIRNVLHAVGAVTLGADHGGRFEINTAFPACLHGAAVRSTRVTSRDRQGI